MPKKQHEITIGGYHASRDPLVLRTLLGSCVAVCLHDRQRKIGGMNHILLPGKADLKHFNQAARFGANAMELLINRMIRLGGRKERFTAKIFGGGQIMPTIGDSLATGPKIVAFVREYLQMESIPLINENTGGTDTRVIFFHTDSGNVFLRRTPSTMGEMCAVQEKEVLKTLKRLRSETEKLADIQWFR